MIRSRSLAGLAWICAAGIVSADQATKAWMSAALGGGGSIRVAPGLAWELTHNNGGAFGVMEGSNLKLIIAAAAAVVVILLWMRRIPSPIVAVALGLLLGGAGGNLIDRIRLGHVVDFIALQRGGRTIFPNFNVADSAITVGACLMAYVWYRIESGRPASRSLTPTARS